VGATTGDDGAYRIAGVPAGAQSITARRLGYRPVTTPITVADGSTTTLDFSLELDVLRMNEVVVTGNSTQTERRQLGNSIGTIDADAMAQSGSIAVDRALSGKVPGVMVQQNSGNPGGGISVRLRGTNTILGSADPLYVVDGVIVSNNSNTLIYAGGYSQNRLIDLNPDDIDHIEVVKGAAAAALYGSRANNGVVQIFTKNGGAGAARFSWHSVYSNDNLRKRLAVNRFPTDAAGNPVQRFDQQDVIFHNANGFENGGSVSGTTGATRYYLSGAYVNDEGIVRNSNFSRASGRVRLDQQLASWASVSAGGTFAVSKDRDVPNGGLASSLYGAIEGFLFGPNTYDPRPDQNGVYQKAQFANPDEVINRYQFGQKTNRFIGDAHLTLTPLEGLKIEYTLGSDNYTQAATAYIPRGVTTPGIYNLGFAQTGTANFAQINNDINVTYAHPLGRQLQTTSALGATFQSEVNVTQGASSYDLSPVSQIVPSGANKTLTEFRSRQIVQGVFGQETFGIADRLFLTGAYRVDASSVFANSQRVQGYPKVSGSYLISDESFWRNTFAGRLFPQFKVRAAWGQSGGLTAIGPFDRFTNYSPVSYEANPGLQPSRQEGSDIRPERQSAYEAGIEASILSDRVGLEANVYRQRTSDLLLTTSVALTTGFSTQLQNVGNIENRGVELLLRATPLSSSQLSWNTTVSYSANRNKVGGVPGGVRVIGGYGLAAAVNGEPLGVYYAAGYARDAQGRILDTNGQLYTDARTQIPGKNSVAHVIGDPNPQWIGSWSNDLKVGKNLSFHTQLDGVFGNDVWNYDARVGSHPSYCTLSTCEDELAGRVAKGRGLAMYSLFEYWVEDGSYVKVRELSATYMLHPRAFGMREIGLSLIGRNLASFDNYTNGYDPETNAGGQATATRGYEFAEVPIPRSIAFRISTAF
jgi:TonB-dependent SusC/RagA subfamily outer membrane receptor